MEHIEELQKQSEVYTWFVIEEKKLESDFSLQHNLME